MQNGANGSQRRPRTMEVELPYVVKIKGSFKMDDNVFRACSGFDYHTNKPWAAPQAGTYSSGRGCSPRERGDTKLAFHK